MTQPPISESERETRLNQVGAGIESTKIVGHDLIQTCFAL